MQFYLAIDNYQFEKLDSVYIIIMIVYSVYRPGTGLVWVNEISCESPQPCFTSCFKHHKWTHDCNHTQDIAIQCGEHAHGVMAFNNIII